MTLRALLIGLAVAATAAPAQAQTARTAVVPDAITVGDVFHAAIRLELPAGVELLPPDSLDVPVDVENAGRPELRVDTTGATRYATVVYPLTAWRPGSYELPRVTLHLVGDGTQRRLTAELPGFTIRSVLPADTTGIEMRAAKDVFGANRIWWPWILAALLALAALFAYVWWRNRRRAVEPVVLAPAVPPRQLALQRLDALRTAGLLERGELKPFYIELTDALRHYAATVDPAWSTDLTTTELAYPLRARPVDASLMELVRLLGSADLVKFARVRPSVEMAWQELDAARAWVERTGPAESEPEAGTELERVA